jgi:hypothetical protein
MYATSISYSNVQSDPGTGVVAYHIDEAPLVKKPGVRIGVFSTNTGRLINFGYGIELGKMPGLETYASDFYINVRICFNLFKKIGLSEE